MKKFLVLGMLAGAVTLTSCNSIGGKTPHSEADSLAYAFGTDLGHSMKMMDSTINVSMLASALEDVLHNKGAMTLEDAHAFLNEYFSVRKPAKTLQESEDFLAGIEKKSGVQKTESGLLYEIIEEGGMKATSNADTVVVIYTGTTPSGVVFDSTENHGTENDRFTLNGVIPAWTEGMKLVGKGGKVKLYAHPDLAYGARGAGQMIGPNQALVFEVEVVDVLPAAVEEDAE